MSPSGITPGPLTVEDHGPTRFRDLTAVDAAGFKRLVGRAHRLDDARLFAAASTLLASLRALVQAANDHHWRDRPIPPALIADAMDAIDLAEGGS